MPDRANRLPVSVRGVGHGPPLEEERSECVADSERGQIWTTARLRPVPFAE
jgi:hypothetical protein